MQNLAHLWHQLLVNEKFTLLLTPLLLQLWLLVILELPLKDVVVDTLAALLIAMLLKFLVDQYLVKEP
jgi:hypothetical protein